MSASGAMHTSQALRAHRGSARPSDDTADAPTTTTAARSQRAYASAPLLERSIATVATRNRWERVQSLGPAVTGPKCPRPDRTLPRTYHLGANTLVVVKLSTFCTARAGDTQQCKSLLPEWTAADNPEAFRR